MEVRSGMLPALDGCVTVGRIAALLAADGEAALPRALDLLVQDLGLRSAVLREVHEDQPGAVLAVAGGVMHAVPLARRPRVGRPDAAAVSLPVGAADHQLATLTVIGARPSQLPALRACASVLALRLDNSRPASAGALFAAADAEVGALADALHDGPVQDLVVARYAADAAVLGADPADAREAVQAALVALRRALWLLRPRGGSEGLATALRALSDQLAAAGAAPLLLELDAAAVAELGEAEAATAYRLVQVVGTATAPGTPLHVVLHREDDEILLRVDGGQPLPDVPAGWTARARALGARLTSTPGRLLLAFPSRLEVAP